MALIIRTTHGRSSDERYRLTNATASIGGSDGSDLVLNAAGLPQEPICVVHTDGDRVSVLCKISNTITVGGRMLENGQEARWRVGGVLQVWGGVIELKLEDDEARDERREPRDSYKRSSSHGEELLDFNNTPARQKSARQARSKTKKGASYEASLNQGSADRVGARTVQSRQSIGKQSFASTYTATILDEDEPNEDKKQSQLFQIALVVLISAALLSGVVFIAVRAKTAPTGSNEVSAAAVYSFLQEFEKGNESASDDAKLDKRFQIAYLKEKNNPELSLISYETLRDGLIVRYNEEYSKLRSETIKDRPIEEVNASERADSEAKANELQRNYNTVSRYIESRVARLSAEIGKGR